VISDAVTAHKFADLASMVRWLHDNGKQMLSAFVSECPAGATVSVLDEQAPEAGALTVLFKHHPRAVRWSSLPERLPEQRLQQLLQR
jgi:hypothetical protein